MSEALADGGFVRVGVKDNFYQTSAFIPMSFALVTTVHENGETGIGPHALVYPLGVASDPHTMVLISRGNSGTAVNLRRTGKAALNYVEYDPERLHGIVNLGYPGQSLEQKERVNPYTLVRSPTPERSADPDAPKIIAEAFQVFECTLDDSFDLYGSAERGEFDGRFGLTLDQILIKEKFEQGIEEGAVFPRMPIFYGFRADRRFWFAEHGEPFAIEPPKVEGQEIQAVYYLANRLDERTRFDREACERLTSVPGPFLKSVLQGIIAAAREKGITEVDAAFIERLDAERGQDLSK